MSVLPAGPGPRDARWRAGLPLLAMVALVLLGGCATGYPTGRMLSGRGHRSLAPPEFPRSPRERQASTTVLEEMAGSAGGLFGREVDAFQVVQEACGLEEEARHPVGEALPVEEVRRLWERLVRTPVTSRSFAPRLALSWLLREALAGDEPVAYAELLHRTERFWPVVMVRPDGYLVAALSGQPIQRMGSVELRDGALKAGNLVIGAFYFSRGGVLYPVDGLLQRSGHIPRAELGLERDWFNAALDGAQDAMVEMALALAQSIVHPIRSAEGLTQLPTTVALLIASSPEYFARYGALSLQDQIREAARLSTHVLLLYGGGAGAVGTVGRIGGLGAELPVLSVTAEGVLAVRTVAVSAGTVTTTLEVGAGSVSIVHMASKGDPAPGSDSKNPYVGLTRAQLERSRRSFIKLIQEHEKKLLEYRTEPFANDNLGKLKNQPPEVQRNIIEGRIQEVEKQLRGQRLNLRRVEEVLRTLEGGD